MVGLENPIPMPRPTLSTFLRSAVCLAGAFLLGSCGDRLKSQADLVFINGAEVGSIDPSQVSAQVDGRVVTSLFEGLMRYNVQGRAEPGVSLEPTVSQDGLTYTFPFRADAKWSNGDTVTSQDFLFAWQRFLLPETAADYHNIFYCIKNAEAFNTGKLTDFSQVGVKAPDPKTLVVTLENPVPYFKDLVAFMAFCPIHVPTWKAKGAAYFKPGQLVGNGPYQLKEWRLNDRIRLERSPTYWDAANVKMASVDVLPIDNPSTAVNLFLTDGSDLLMDKGLIPNALADELSKKNYFHHKPFLATWFIRFNAKHPPYSDPRVRKALTLVLDRERIVTAVTRLGEVPAFSITPPGTGDNYQPPAGLHPDIAEAKKLLAEAGFPDGRGFPVLNFLYPSKFPTDHGIAVELMNMWQKNLGITVALSSEEYKTYLDSQKKEDYDVCRSSWVGDYNDPNTFLDMFLANSGNNRTGWASPAYDALITQAAKEADAAKRYGILKQAETQLIETECVVAPVYHYVGVQFYQPDFLGGVEANLIDEHPLRCMFWKQTPPRLQKAGAPSGR
ncbi:MAG: oligopeptide transport system substrate-binding protein [Verrucomicrobiales bacterium]|nr:oligopeptide transport system substrate-binding protein [Verrucomicrobiales bacterium]